MGWMDRCARAGRSDRASQATPRPTNRFESKVFEPLVEPCGRTVRSVALIQSPMISHARNGEDVVLRRAFRDLDSPGFYVDVGACHSVSDSTTFHFSERGWRGINVEPDAGLHAALERSRPQDINLAVAVARVRGRIDLCSVGKRTLGSTDSATADERGVEAHALKVPAMPLSDILDLYGPENGAIAFLRVSVGGLEADVLASNDWHRHRPRIVLVRSIDGAGHPTFGVWEPDLLASGYVFALFDGLNRFFCRREDSELLLNRLAAPANALDGWRRASEATALTDVARMTAEGEERDRGHNDHVSLAELRIADSVKALRAAEARADALGLDLDEARAAVTPAIRARDSARRLAEEAAGAQARVQDLEKLNVRLSGQVARAEAHVEALFADLERSRRAAAAALAREERAEIRLADQETHSDELMYDLVRAREDAIGKAAKAGNRPEDADTAPSAQVTALSTHREELANVQARFDAIQKSLSWRITRPVRWVVSRLKNQHHGG